MEKFSEEVLTCVHFDWEGPVGFQILKNLLEHRGKVREYPIRAKDFEDLEEVIHSDKFRVMNYVFEAITLYQHLCRDSDTFIKVCLDEEMTESRAFAVCGLIHMLSRAESLSVFNKGSWYWSLHNLDMLTKRQEIYFFVMYFLIVNYEKYEDGLNPDELGGDGVAMSNYKIYNILHSSNLLDETIGKYLDEMKKIKTMCVQLLENKMVAKAYLELAKAYAKLKGRESIAQYFGQFIGYPEDCVSMVGEDLARQTLKDMRKV